MLVLEATQSFYYEDAEIRRRRIRRMWRVCERARSREGEKKEEKKMEEEELESEWGGGRGGGY